jgi:hypothetical protein
VVECFGALVVEALLVVFVGQVSRRGAEQESLLVVGQAQTGSSLEVAASAAIVTLQSASSVQTNASGGPVEPAEAVKCFWERLFPLVSSTIERDPIVASCHLESTRAAFDLFPAYWFGTESPKRRSFWRPREVRWSRLESRQYFRTLCPWILRADRIGAWNKRKQPPRDGQHALL